MDDAERGEKVTQILLDDALRFRHPAPLATGACHWCSELLDRLAIFCCAECRDDWQREQDAKRRNGK